MTSASTSANASSSARGAPLPCAVLDKTGESLPIDVARVRHRTFRRQRRATGAADSAPGSTPRALRRLGGSVTAAPPVATTRPERPYPGLRPFEQDEWAIFFGRERMIDEVIGRLAESRLVLIHGVSGSGKSSLVRAGVLPKLALQYRRHGAPWLTCEMRPSGGPLWNLAAEFARLEGRGGDLERISAIAARSTRARRASPRSPASLDGVERQEPLPARRPVRGVVSLREGDEPRRGGAVRRSRRARRGRGGERGRRGRGRPACDRHHALGIPRRMRPLRRLRRDHQPHAISRAAHGRRRAHARRAPAGADVRRRVRRGPRRAADRLGARARGRAAAVAARAHADVGGRGSARAAGRARKRSTARSSTRPAASPSFCPATPTR